MDPIIKIIINGHARISRKGRYVDSGAPVPCVAIRAPIPTAKSARPPTSFQLKRPDCLVFIALTPIIDGCAHAPHTQRLPRCTASTVFAYPPSFGYDAPVLGAT